MILAATSLNPTTGAYFHTNLSDRRYTEAESLLLAKNDISGLSSFIDEVSVTQLAITEISDPQKQQELNTALIVKIDSYQSGLTKVQTQVETAASASENVAQEQSQNIQEAQENPSPAISRQASAPVQESKPQLSVPTKPPSVETFASVPVTVAINQTREKLKKIKEKARQGGERDDKKEKEKQSEDQKDQKKEEKQTNEFKQTSEDFNTSKKSRVDKN